MKRPAGKPGTRVYFTFQQFTFARWFGTAAVVSFNSEYEEFVTNRDPGSSIDHVAPAIQTWPAHHVYSAKYQLDVTPEDGPILVGPVVAKRAQALGYVHGVHFFVSDLYQEN